MQLFLGTRDVLVTIGFLGILSLSLTMGFVWIQAYMHGGQILVTINEAGEALPELLMLCLFTFAALWHSFYILGLALIGRRQDDTERRLQRIPGQE